MQGNLNDCSQRPQPQWGIDDAGVPQRTETFASSEHVIPSVETGTDGIDNRIRTVVLDLRKESRHIKHKGTHSPTEFNYSIYKMLA